MAIVIEPVYADGIAQLSYLVGDDSAGVGAVIDPRPDCDIYLELAKEKGLRIIAIYETHIHADFMSGSLALRKRLGGDVPVRVSIESGPDYSFDYEPTRDGDESLFGELRLVARHTPGHTPEHLSYLAHHGDEDDPFAVFSGDTLFVESVGRPDLLGDDETNALAKELFESIHGFFAQLPDGTMLYPGHGAGSSCGPDIGDRMYSTIGYEKVHNVYFSLTDEEDFIDKVLGEAPEEPRHYRPMKKLNASAADSRMELGFPKAFSPEQVESLVSDGSFTVLDCRSPIAFSAEHIPRSLNIAAQGEMSVWSGWLLEFDQPLVLVLERDTDLESTLALLWRTAHANVIGYLSGGIMNWIMEGKPVSCVKVYDPGALHEALDEVQVLDVRSESEHQAGFIPSSKHIFVPDLEAEAKDSLDPQKPVVTYCASGFRASIAASILKRMGFENVGTLPGSWMAWKSASLPIARPEKEMQPA
ncbi:MBL fold metallo-hydrolase [Pelagicoccus sp. SDUM812002]|uniref:MBL fold metallo-hydrolase n=1 Tax=Pelagicoccus sp. SDUM812002 TaxID=3041266 RepID=UPI00280E2807|nr:MBL fold metallo-hydrolase [Pelagicoccus sp. SDUM812002]MDQ8186800.1 MBL fold metallo-hydrolase [Pelagicoccus sp. SDUM812002]